MNKPLLSIITSIYNGGEDLFKFFECISNQSYENLEIIIMEDCSTDPRTLEIVQDLKEGKITLNKPYKIIQNTKNLGTVYSFQEGLKYASGEYFTFPQTDDYIDSDFYEILMEKALKTNCDVVKGLLLCEYTKEEAGKVKQKDDIGEVVTLIDNTQLPIIIKNEEGQTISYLMPDITYCWFYLFNRRFLLDNSNTLNFLNAVKYGVSKATYVDKYKEEIIPSYTCSFYHHNSHKGFKSGGIYNRIHSDNVKSLCVEKQILSSLLDIYTEALEKDIK